MIKSIYRRGADDGLIFGIYLSAIFLCSVIGVGVPILSILSLLLIIALPLLLFKFLRRSFVASNGLSTFSEVWMLGILIFLFGSLICGVVTYVYLQFIEPTFIYDQVNAALDIYKSMPQMKDAEFVKIIQQAIDQHLLPSAIQIVIQMIWFTIFSGSLLSLLLSAIVRAIRIKE
ncbi:MAG: DUF4199 domain-containing protein [Muribaculaceae bacterium]|nr:DUF4199 domain-containing protein [Muribaculaceae bacterium]